jgi:hypothetical protein
MAGFREFVTGEVLTAANVDDFLAKQAVMKFADAAARDTALGTAVAGGNALREGMVAYLDDEDAPSFYDGSAWGPISVPIAGIGSNVVQAVKTDTFTTSSATFVDITGLTATITPTLSTSKILVVASAVVSETTGGVGAYGVVAVYRSTTQLDIFGSQQARDDSANKNPGGFTVSYLDSPNTTSATTYSIRARRTSGTAIINRSRDAVSSNYSSSITLIEVAA